jgi:hypothetical protein
MVAVAQVHDANPSLRVPNQLDYMLLHLDGRIFFSVNEDYSGGATGPDTSCLHWSPWWRATACSAAG